MSPLVARAQEVFCNGAWPRAKRVAADPPNANKNSPPEFTHRFH